MLVFLNLKNSILSFYLILLDLFEYDEIRLILVWDVNTYLPSYYHFLNEKENTFYSMINRLISNKYISLIINSKNYIGFYFNKFYNMVFKIKITRAKQYPSYLFSLSFLCILAVVASVNYAISISYTLAQSSSSASSATNSSFNVNTGVYPINSKSLGLSYGDLSTKWWQWAASISADKSPMKDNTGANCAQGQTYPVWFLAGTFGGSAQR
jgi:hypothetical protein